MMHALIDRTVKASSDVHACAKNICTSLEKLSICCEDAQLVEEGYEAYACLLRSFQENYSENTWLWITHRDRWAKVERMAGEALTSLQTLTTDCLNDSDERSRALSQARETGRKIESVLQGLKAEHDQIPKASAQAAGPSSGVYRLGSYREKRTGPNGISKALRTWPQSEFYVPNACHQNGAQLTTLLEKGTRNGKL